MKRILFVCKHNMFRSKTADAYFNKINKNKKIIIESAGIIRGYFPLDKKEVAMAKSLGISLVGKPRGLSIDLVKKQDMIIIVADDVPKIVFNRKEYIDFDKTKIIKWNVRDNLPGTSQEKLRRIVETIMKKVDELNEELQRKWK